ncbi:hypothetical protein L596_015049 [Steinernema carpocapsae]|uniref:Uncharacterized protein n=1 Tax=Steinernema carpocapsae TaxID=34508 RepID=A0A4V6A2Z8_STECR|nr:hypothetical protein L596_015049 [Steinernema carpocapsae]
MAAAADPDLLTARFKEQLSSMKVFPTSLRSRLSYEAHDLRAAHNYIKESKSSEVRCHRCHIALSGDNGTLRVLLKRKKPKTMDKKKRIEPWAQCIGCKNVLRCGVLPQRSVAAEEEFLDESIVREQKGAPLLKNSTPVNMLTPPVKK